MLLLFYIFFTSQIEVLVALTSTISFVILFSKFLKIKKPVPFLDFLFQFLGLRNAADSFGNFLIMASTQSAVSIIIFEFVIHILFLYIILQI